jgi:hypothetical protein
MSKKNSGEEGLIKRSKGGMEMEKSPLSKRFTPERYGMILCPLCNGRGKYSKNPNEIIVCATCGGFGMIKRPMKGPMGVSGFGDEFHH